MIEFKEHKSGLLVNKNGDILHKNGYIPKKTKDGKYLCVCYKGQKYLVHRLVMETYEPLEEYNFNITVDHINNDKYDNRYENLRWLTRGENSRLGNLGEKNRNHIDMINKTPKCGKPVIGINKYTGEMVEYCSIIEAERQLNIKNCLNPVLKGDRKSAGGFYWKYKII